MQTIYHPGIHQPPADALYLNQASIQRRVLDDQVELWWFREPRRSLLCYCASVALVLGLGLGGVGLLSTTTSLSGEWRLGVGTTLCLLALTVLLKQLLSSAVQDMNCVHSRRQIERLKSGGRTDPALILAVGLALIICGTALVCLAMIGGRRHDGKDMLASGLVLTAAGTGMSLAVVGYSVLFYIKRRRREQMRRRRRMMRTGRARRPGSQTVRVFSVSGGDKPCCRGTEHVLQQQDQPDLSGSNVAL